MARSLHVRLDDASDAALRLLRAEQGTDSAAVRLALQEAASRRRRHAAIREEVRALAADPADRTEMAIVRREMDALSPDWD